MSVVNGKDVILSVQKGAALYPIACNSVCTLTFQRDVIETTFRGTGDIRGFVPGKCVITLEGSGAIELAGDYTSSDVIDALLFKQTINWEFVLTDSKGHATINKTYSGSGFFTSATLTGDIQQAATCDYTIQVNGAISGTTDPGTLPPVLQTLFYTATGGETSLFNDAWVDGDMLEVLRNGIGLEIITTGTPTPSQVLYNAGAGTLTFSNDLPLGVDEYIQTLFES